MTIGPRVQARLLQAAGAVAAVAAASAGVAQFWPQPGTLPPASAGTHSANPPVTPSGRASTSHHAAGRTGPPVQIISYQGHPAPSTGQAPGTSPGRPTITPPPGHTTTPPPVPSPSPELSPEPAPVPSVTVPPLITTSPVCVTVPGIRICLPIGVTG